MQTGLTELLERLNVPNPPHNLRWNPELQEWFCSACGRTSDHTLEADARTELDTFECKIVGVQHRELTEEEKAEWHVTQKLRNKF